ncbi:hypothetical protein ACFQ0G_10200 [Streptomyces chiangmaiensis]
MAGGDHRGLRDCPGNHDGAPETGAGVHVQNQLESVIQDFRTSEPPIPVFVVHAEDGADDDAAADVVRQLYAGQEAHGTRCAMVPDEYDGDRNDLEIKRAATMVRALSDPRVWGGPKAVYRRYAFPRLRLVHAIDDAVEALGAAAPAARERRGNSVRGC